MMFPLTARSDTIAVVYKFASPCHVIVRILPAKIQPLQPI